MSRDSLPEPGALSSGMPPPQDATEQTSATAASARRSGAEHHERLGENELDPPHGPWYDVTSEKYSRRSPDGQLRPSGPHDQLRVERPD